jgi:hypothetical protein
VPDAASPVRLSARQLVARRARSALGRSVGWFTRARLRYLSSLVPSQRS